MSIMESLLSRLKATVEREQLFSKGESILAAFSGGIDSRILVESLHLLQTEYALSITIAHFNHRLRGAESDLDEAFCREIAQSSGMPCIVEYMPPPAALPSGSLQMQARTCRYDFLNRAARHAGCTRIALGHNSDDCVETMLLHLFQGTSPAGLASIPYKRGLCIRPLLDIPRSDIEAASAERGLSCREDASNRTEKYDRNWLRNAVLPLVQQRFPAASRHMTRLCRDVKNENALFESLYAGYADFGFRQCGGELRLDLGLLRKAPLPLSLRRIAAAALYISGANRGPGHAFYNAAGNYVSNPQSGRIWYAGAALRVYEEYGDLVFAPPATVGAFTLHMGLPPLPCSIDVPSGTLHIEETHLPDVSRKHFKEKAKNGIFFVNAAAETLVLRSRCPGDRMRLPVSGSRKLKDILIDRKIPGAAREELLVLSGAEEIMAFFLPSCMPESRVAQNAMVREPGTVLCFSWQSRE